MTVAAAGSGADPARRLEDLAVAYRAFAVANARSMALIFTNVAPGAEPSAESQAAAAGPLLDVVREIVGDARALAAARVVTAYAFGFTTMETAGAFRFGGDVAEAYRLGVVMLVAGLAEAGRPDVSGG